MDKGLSHDVSLLDLQWRPFSLSATPASVSAPQILSYVPPSVVLRASGHRALTVSRVERV